MIRLFALAIIGSLLIGSSCRRLERMATTKEQKANIVSQDYEKDGVNFAFPNDWEIKKDSVGDKEIREIEIVDRHYTHFKIALAPSGSYHDLSDNVQLYQDGFRKNLKIGSVVGFESTSSTRERSEQKITGIRLRYSIDLAPEVFYLAELYTIKRGKSDALITVIYPEKDFNAADKEIELIFESIKFDV